MRTRKSGVSRKTRRTKEQSRKSKNTRRKFSKASANMTLSELQFMAKSVGVPFGGLTKTKLIRKINNYY